MSMSVCICTCTCIIIVCYMYVSAQLSFTHTRTHTCTLYNSAITPIHYELLSSFSLISELHSFVENGENHLFFQLYTNQSTEKVDLGTRWFDRHIEPDSTETLLYRYMYSTTVSQYPQHTYDCLINACTN